MSKIRFRVGEFSVSFFAACGNFIPIYDDGADVEVARVIERKSIEKGTTVNEPVELLKERVQIVCDALNIVYDRV